MEDLVLCGANAQSMRWYFNEEAFGRLPVSIKKELKVLCVSYCADVGGILTITFDPERHLHLNTISPIDEIGAELKVRQLQGTYQELFLQLEQFAKAFQL